MRFMCLGSLSYNLLKINLFALGILYKLGNNSTISPKYVPKYYPSLSTSSVLFQWGPH